MSLCHPLARRLLGVAATAVLAAAGLTLTGMPAHAGAPALGQHVAVPAYMPPSDTTDWNTLNASGSQLGIVVVNVYNGPGNAPDRSWKATIAAAHAHGEKVLGYVDTGYLGQTTPPRLTGLGDTDETSWTVQAEQDVDRWYAFYGSDIDGIFFDDVLNTCGPTSNSDAYANQYESLSDFVHATHPGALTVSNPGIAVPSCYANTADVIGTFEGDAATYLNPPADQKPKTWQLKDDPDKFWNIVYNVSSAQLPAVIAQSKADNAGYIYATPDTLPNPYDTAPDPTYWSAELAATTSTSTAVPPTPQQPYAKAIYSTSADLAWPPSSSTDVVGYNAYLDGTQIGSTAATSLAPVGLTPDTTYSLTVRARSVGGVLSAPSPAFTFTTDVEWGSAPTAPGALTATNVSANGVQLSWTASSGSNDQVAYYDVYENGQLELTLPATVTSIHLGELQPGTHYSFTVIARVTSGTPSQASNTVKLKTPSPTPITDPEVTLNATTAHFQAQYNLAYSFHNVYIDTDNNPATGYQAGGVGAEYLLEDGALYQNVSDTNSWSWTPVSLASSPLTSTTGGLYVWDIPASALGTPLTTISVAFNGSGNS
ncbi:MAG: fibronectin type III domain-containing protein, partial [Acidimicrobiaceae bacterium]|nr:fibronectin type III domain-containing protein [Acidimicrobiaceae bacterium]